VTPGLLINPGLLVTLLAEEPSKTGPDFGKASPIGLLVVVLLLIGVFALVWSMNRHLKKIPASFDTPEGDQSVGLTEVSSQAEVLSPDPADSDTEEHPRESSG
jgi:hypothetical protein